MNFDFNSQVPDPDFLQDRGRGLTDSISKPIAASRSAAGSCPARGSDIVVERERRPHASEQSWVHVLMSSCKRFWTLSEK
jgi:hypothetical protein